ncbi:MAG: hypothetical protein M3R27_09650, partial [Bacteroidota bacterium]|nr:hypothetical protein [Bacteroidota bacterium]
MRDTLVLFTKSFPFNNDETFLLPELEVHYKEFKRVFIVPHNTGDKIIQHKLPEHVTVLMYESLSSNGRLRSLFLFLFFALPLELLGNFNFKGIFKKLRFNFGFFRQSYLRSEQIKKWLVQHNIAIESSCFYSYWLNENALSLALVKRDYPSMYSVGRGHGYDVFPSQAKYGYNRFQAIIIKRLSLVISVSETGAAYLCGKYPDSSEKIICSYLGTPDPSVLNVSDPEKITIVSCAHIRQIKALHRIPLVLASTGRKCKWI